MKYLTLISKEYVPSIAARRCGMELTLTLSPGWPSDRKGHLFLLAPSHWDRFGNYASQSSRAKGLLTWYTSQVIKINHKTSQRCQTHIQRHLLIPKITCEGTEWGTQSQAGSASLEVEACFPGGVNGMHRKTCGVAGKVGKCREWDSRSTWKRIFKELTALGS